MNTRRKSGGGGRGSGSFASVVAFVPFICVLPALAQEQVPPRPQFETTAELVLVDVTVLDRSGRPVDSLTADDFEVQVNGRRRPVESVQFISSAAASATAPASARDAYYSGNDAPSTGRLLLFVVDEASLRFGAARVVMTAAEGILERLAPGDLVGLTRLPGGAGGVEFTADRQRVKDALSRVTGQATSMGQIQGVYLSEAAALERGGFEWERALERECGDAGAARRECEASLAGEARSLLAQQTGRTFQTVRALEGLFERLAMLRAPTTVVLISEGLFIATERTSMTRLARLAAQARATLQIVQPSQGAFSMETNQAPYPMQDEALMVEGLEVLAGQTAGGLHRIAGGSGAGVFDRLSTELSGYYLLGFVPTDEDRTGRERRIRVTVRPRGLTVRARPTFVVRDAESDPDAVTLAPAEHLRSLLVAPLPDGDLPMRVATYVSTSAQAGKLRLTIAAEVGEPATESARLPVALILLDRDDRIVASGDFTPDAQPVSADEPTPRLVLTSLLVEPGDYTLRIAAVDGARGGSVYHPVTARLRPLRGGVAASDIVLTGASLRPGETPRPTAAGFLRTQGLTVMLELDGPPDVVRGSTAAMEIATDADAPVLIRAQARHADRAGGAQRSFEAVMDAAVLPPGEYVARAVISVPGQPDQRLVRPLRLEPPSADRVVEAAAERAAAARAAEAPIPAAPARIIAPVPRFSVAVALDPSTVRPFLDELEERMAVSGEAAAVLEQARQGTFIATEADARTTPQEEVVLAFVRGLAALEKQEPAQAFAWFRQVQRGVSDYMGAAFYLGAALALQGQDREAVGAWQLALLSDGAPAVYPVLIDALLRLGEGEQALDLIEEAPELWHDQDGLARRRATVQAMLGEYGPALLELGALLERAPEDADLLFTALQVLYRVRIEDGALSADAREQFERWAEAYARANGPQTALVDSWRQYIRSP